MHSVDGLFLAWVILMDTLLGIFMDWVVFWRVGCGLDLFGRKSVTIILPGGRIMCVSDTWFITHGKRKMTFWLRENDTENDFMIIGNKH